MVSICCGKEGCLAEFFFQCFGSENVIRKVFYLFSCFFCYVAGHGKGPSEDFKRIQPKSVGLILYVNAVKSQIISHSVQPGQRCFAVLGKAFMEGSGFLYLIQRHDA